nr:hypothetical protein [Tanacetum cinerariifolium]
MAGLVEGGRPEGIDDREETPPPLTKEHIKGHVSGLKSLVKSHNRRNKADPIRLDFKLEDTEAFAARYSVRKTCFKKPHEITKIIRKANESITEFKERWTVKTGFIMEGTTGHSRTPIRRNHEGMIIEAITEEETRTLQAEQEMTRLLKDAIGNGFRVGKVESLSEECMAEGKGIPWRGCSPTSKDNQCDKCELCERKKIKEAEVEGYLVRRVERLSKACKDQLRCLLKDNIGVFAWEPSDMTGVSRQFIEHMLNVNLSLDPVCPKRRTFSTKKIRKFLVYMVTSEGIRANPKKTKALADLQSLRTLKEMQSLTEKLATLNRFLTKKIITILQHTEKHNQGKQERIPMYPVGRGSFPTNEEAHYGPPFINSALGKRNPIRILGSVGRGRERGPLTGKKGRQCPIQYVSRTLNEAERNYDPIEKLALSFIHVTRRLRRYFEAYPVKVITDQPIKNILNNTTSSRNLAKYTIELRDYNIMFMPRNIVKGQVLADFLSEAPKGVKEELYFWMLEVPSEKDDTKS